MASVRLPDGSIKEFEDSVTVKQVAKSIGSRLAKDAMWGEIDGQPVKLDYLIEGDAPTNLKIITRKDVAALATMRHSCAHVMARAVMRLKPNVQLAFGPTIDGGFYYDIESPDDPIKEEDFPAIEAEMQKIVELDEPFERLERSRDDSIQICQDLQQPLKVEHIEEGLADETSLSFYQQGEFLDLCRGPHVPSPKSIGAFKLLSIAGAYWKGDESRQQLQRLYATAFFDKKALNEHLERIEEAKKRDHRVLNKRLAFYHIDEDVGQGLILWTPRGAFIRQKLQDFISEHLARQGYEQVFTPQIGKLDLYRTSGHFPYYQDSQYPPIVMRDQLNLLAEEGCSCSELANKMKDGEIDGYMLRPMNCPHHIKIYGSQQRSYRDLPIRFCEFGTVYRWEQSGEIGGLTRVRGFTQDDAHLFCTEEQLADEVKGCLELVEIVLGAMGLDDYRVRVGLRDPDSGKYVGEAENWDRAEQACRDAAASLGRDFSEEPGEAAFYGPKIDFVVRDCIGREWQLGTVQVDYNLPVRFDLHYIGADNQPHRPVMIHRAPFGSMERFIGVLIEHFAGAFPLWLNPEQGRVLTVSEKSEDYGREVQDKFRKAGLRITSDFRSEKLGAKIRDAQIEMTPYMFVVGPRDAENGTVSVRDRLDGDQGAMSIDEAIAKLQQEVADRVVRVKHKSDVSLVGDGVDNEY
ncbi:MAG: threonine--tRNA ligase [Planctomycetaceae bacterium]|nr:threonine--tRNA ligase [Planctomycetaceae bacterium]MCP4462957.1 threonine--tRNA ligase [Planctomycetaceae bacterium]MDG1808243.1 threonine--tRNA ligase [Pirellulaceae bacterium]MDG2103547.1 threonine--tRNA ligase [Pirellulaceae bacterium]